jgi:hypothetical protein
MSNDDKELYVISGNEFNELTETIATLRAEKLVLIDALIEAVKYVSYSEREKFKQTLAKIETK